MSVKTQGKKKTYSGPVLKKTKGEKKERKRKEKKAKKKKIKKEKERKEKINTSNFNSLLLKTEGKKWNQLAFTPLLKSLVFI